MSTEQEYQELIELYIQIGEAVKGETLPAEKAWLYDTEQLAAKLLSHVLSLFYLYHGTNLDRVTPLRIAFFDFPSALVLLRAALETYLTFYEMLVLCCERVTRNVSAQILFTSQRVMLSISNP